jgi:methylmalonyl-CoA mutase C-terminal domain/subunit
MSSAETSSASSRVGRAPLLPRVLLTKSFIDSHDRAIGTIAKALRDAGMEVILQDYRGPEEIAAAAIQEDVDVIGVSFMSGGQVDVTRRLMEALGDAEHRVPVVVGGTIRPFDLRDLNDLGVKAIFRGGETLSAIVDTFWAMARDSRSVGRGEGPEA